MGCEHGTHTSDILTQMKVWAPEMKWPGPEVRAHNGINDRQGKPYGYDERTGDHSFRGEATEGKPCSVCQRPYNPETDSRQFKVKEVTLPNGAKDWVRDGPADPTGVHGAPYRDCGYCGSIHPEELWNVLLAGARLGGSDWKYGWPHKFYMEHTQGKEGKFYSEHLKDIEDPETFARFCTVLEHFTGIRFSLDPTGRLMYAAPHAGYQR